MRITIVTGICSDSGFYLAQAVARASKIVEGIFAKLANLRIVAISVDAVQGRNIVEMVEL